MQYYRYHWYYGSRVLRTTKSMCRRRPTGAALAIVAALAHQASGFVAPSATMSTLPSSFSSFSSRLLASVEDATVAADGNAAIIEEETQEITVVGENPRKSGLALMLDDGELFAYTTGSGGAELLAVEAAAADEIKTGRRTMVEIPSEIMYHGNLVVQLPLRHKARKGRKDRKRRLLRRFLSRMRAS